MARLIDADKFEVFVIRTNGDEEFVNGVQYVLEKIDNAPIVEAIPKDQYENRLKADVVNMFTELQSEIEELPMYYDPLDISDLIQEKINALKEGKDGTNEKTSDS